MISLEEAWAILERSVEPLVTTTVGLEGALGRVLAVDCVADRDFPPTDRSAMDGFAVRSADLIVAGARLRIVGEQAAGRPAGPELTPGEAVRIYTGAVVPPGADAVVMVERTTVRRGVDPSDPTTAAVDDEWLSVEGRVDPGDHIRAEGSDLRAGAAVLRKGARIRAAEIAALASIGATTIAIQRPPTAAVLSTGDEIVEADGTPAPHQIRNSNASMLCAALAERGHAARYLGVAVDRRQALLDKIRDGLRDDVLLLTGGVSVGAYDLVADALREVGAEVLFHGVAIKPGKPVLVANSSGRWIFALPGNPISAYAGFRLFVLPVLKRLEADADWLPEHVPVILTEELRCRPGRTTYHLSTVVERDGRRVGARIGATGSGDVLALARANAFLVTGSNVGFAAVGQILPGLLFA